MGKTYQVTVTGFKGEKLVIDLCNTEEQLRSMTVLQLKHKIFNTLPNNTEPQAIRLIFADKCLEDDSSPLSTYGVQHMSVIHMVIRVPGGLLV